MMILKNLLKLKILLKEPVVILKIWMQRQVLVLKCQFQELYMTKTHIIHLHMLGLWMFISKMLRIMIRTHGGISTREFINLILDRFNYFLNRFLRTVKIIQMSHKTFHLKSRGIFKPFPWKKFYMRRWL